MKKVIINCRKSIMLCLISVLLIGNAISKGLDHKNAIQVSANNNVSNKTYFEPKSPPQGSLEELYYDAFMIMLLPYIQEEVSNYYKETTGYSPSVDPWSTKIIYIKRPNGYRTFLFKMELEVLPYLGAHNSIGVDHITLSVSYNVIKVLKYEHIKSYPIPPWLRH